MSKRTSLTAAVIMKKGAAAAAPSTLATEGDGGKPQRGRGRPASDKVVVQQTRMSREAKVQLAKLKADLSERYRRTVLEQDLLRMGLDLVFERFGKPPLGGAPDFLFEPPGQDDEFTNS